MALENYSVFRGKVVDFHAERGDDPTPHFQIFAEGDGRRIRAAVNVKSKLPPSHLAFFIDRAFAHPVTELVEKLSEGYTRLPANEKKGLDYLRSNLFDLRAAEALPPDAPGVEDDLQDMVFSLCRSAKEAGADVFIFGEPFPNGIHDIHMNQGNFGRFARDNGIYQDGGVLFHFRPDKRLSALFLAFQSQAVQTDEAGDPKDGSPRFADIISDKPPGEAIRIVGALVNPEGQENQPDHAGRKESITVINRSPNEESLDGWKVATGSGERILNHVRIGPGETSRIELAGNPPLSNKGGTITLLDAAGRKVHGVSYVRQSREKEGWTILF